MNSVSNIRRCVIGIATAVFVMGWAVVLPQAAAVGGFVVYNSSTNTYTISPNGVDDTANIQAALDACAAEGPGCTVQLEKGVFHTAQITVYGLQGKFLGRGEKWTTVEALPNLPSPAPSVGFNVIPPGPDNLWPDMFTFVDGDFTISDITFSEPWESPSQGWNIYDWQTDALCAIFMITGSHADVTVDHVTMIGASGSLDGFGTINGIYYEGLMLPPDWTDPWGDAIPLSGTFRATDNTFIMIENELAIENLVDAQVTARFNAFYTSEAPIGIWDVSHSVLDISANRIWDARASGVDFAGIYLGQAFLVSPMQPSLIRITDNEIHATRGTAGIWLIDYGAERSLDAVVSRNTIYLDQTSWEGILSMSMRSVVVANNEIRGASPAGIRFLSSGGAIKGNEIRGSAVGIWLDSTTGVQVKGNEVKDSGQWGIALTSGSSGNAVVNNEIKDSGAYDLYWDQIGSGNVWRNNEYKTSNPPGL